MKKFASHFFESVGVWFESWKFISTNRLLHYFIFPVLISLVLSTFAVVLIKSGVDYIMQFIEPYVQQQPLSENFSENILIVIQNLGKYAASFVLFLLGLYIFSRIHKYLVLAAMAPVMALLSDRVYEILTGQKTPFALGPFLHDVFRGIVLSVRNMFMEFALSFFFWAASLYLSLLLPFLEFIILPVTAVVLFINGAYFFGFTTMDYYLEKRKFGVRQSIQIIRKNRYAAIGNGAVFSLLFVVPFVGVSVATITCTVSSMLYMHRLNQNEQSKKVE